MYQTTHIKQRRITGKKRELILEMRDEIYPKMIKLIRKWVVPWTTTHTGISTERRHRFIHAGVKPENTARQMLDIAVDCIHEKHIKLLGEIAELQADEIWLQELRIQLRHDNALFNPWQYPVRDKKDNPAVTDHRQFARARSKM